MQRKIKIKNEEIARELEEIGVSAFGNKAKASGFRVPEGYFESFSSKLGERIAAEEKAKTSPGAKVIRLRAIVGMAASFLLLIALGISFLMLRNGKEEGFLADTQDFVYDEYFARASEMDRSLLFDLILPQEELVPEEPFHNPASEDDYYLDYLLDAAQFHGIEPIELITQAEIDNQQKIIQDEKSGDK